MRCPRCDAKVKETATLCRFCGQDLSVIHYVQRVSNAYYNMGLEKAQVRDLSGAIAVLKKSLQFNKKNAHARNLLGRKKGRTLPGLVQRPGGRLGSVGKGLAQGLDPAWVSAGP